MTGDALELHDDGYATLRLAGRGGSQTTLLIPPPTLGDLDTILTTLERGQTKLREIEDVEQRVNVILSKQSPYAETFALALDLLVGQDIPVEKLPAWACKAEAIVSLRDHWLNVPLRPGTPRPSDEPTNAPNDAPNVNAPSTVGKAVNIVEASSA